MAKTLELLFGTELGKQASVSLDQPKEPLDPIAVRAAMEAIIASNALFTVNGNLTLVNGARVIDRNVTLYEI